MKPPFPYFGGKSRVAPLVWDRFGDVPNYIEPFFGSGAVLFARPTLPKIETVNDKDAYLANFWRALRADPEAVAHFADWPVNEADLDARHKWLVETNRKREFTARMKADPDYYDANIAGWWVWGLCSWIGAGWCSGEWFGPGSEENNGSGINVRDPEHGGKRPHLGDAGQGVHRKLPHLGAGRGVHRARQDSLVEYFAALAARLRNVRVCCGDWSRICGPSPTFKHGLTGVFLDPPYSEEADRTAEIYAAEDLAVAHDVREWAIANGDNPLLRIALCGYESEHAMPESWECVAWKAHGGYGAQQGKKGNHNAARERIWFSPSCLRPTLFSMQELIRHA